MTRRRRRPWNELVVPLALIVFGGYLFLRELVPDLPLARAWPMGLIAIGVLLVLASVGGRGAR